MNGRLKLGGFALGAAALFTVTSFPVSVAAQESQTVSGRFRVLIPNLEARNDADRRFGERVADELRKLIDQLPTHQSVDNREIRDALRRFRIDERELDCIKARQLAGQINAQVVMCGSYTPTAGGLEVAAKFVQVQSGEEFDVESATVEQRAHQQAAQEIFDSFENYVQQLRFAQFCGDYAASSQWQNALENCDRAIELNPQSVTARYTRARTLMELDQKEDALTEFQRVLEINPIHENALQYAGFVSAQLGQEDQARRYYREYLELNPGNAHVRMRVAYDLAQAGDPFGAMELVEGGIELDPENVDLYEQHGNFAFAAASQAMESESSSGDSEGLPPHVQELYRKAIASYEKVFAEKGGDAEVNQLRNIIAAHVQLGELDQALQMSQRAVDARPDEAVLWSTYADALQRADRLDEAIRALDEVKRIDSAYPNLAVRQGKWLLDAGRLDDAMPLLKEAVARQEQPADVVANMVFADAYQKGVQARNWTYAVRTIEKAKEFDVTPQTKARLDFFHGYSIYSRAIEAQKPQTLETAQATLPQFQQALALFQSGRPYQNEQPSANINQFLEATNTYIEIQDAIIRRGR